MSVRGRLIGNFLKGLLVVAPVGFTLYICYKLFTWINAPLSTFLQNHAPQLNLPGLGFAITVLLATVVLIIVGYLSSNLLMSGLLDAVDRQFGRLPLIKLVHSSLKDMIGAFAGKNRGFDQPVLVSLLPDGSVKVAGFVTRKSMEGWGLPGYVTVYLPAAYNFGGQLIIVPKERVAPAPVAGADLMAFVISGGISGGDPRTTPKTD